MISSYLKVFEMCKLLLFDKLQSLGVIGLQYYLQHSKSKHIVIIFLPIFLERCIFMANAFLSWILAVTKAINFIVQ